MNILTKACLQLSTPLLVLSTFSGVLPLQLPLQPSAATAQTQLSPASKLYQRTTPAVVTIKNGKALGSGFLIGKDGLIITNAHVVANGPRVVTVRLHNGQQVPADVIGFANNGVDLAALRIYGQASYQSLPLATSSTIQVGQPIYAIGTPLSEKYQNTLTRGIINQLDAETGILFHDAQLRPGNSGGPLLNDQGQVIGVNFGGDLSRTVYGQHGRQIGRTTSGLNYAISLPHLQGFLQDLDRGQSAQTATLP